MEWDFGALGTAGRYKLLVALVTPRPIAFVSTRGRDGVDNAAPFSFFNVLADDPPVVIVSIERRLDGRSKDSGRNILETGEFVVNMVDEDLLERMHLCSVEFPSEVSEFAQAGLTAAPARKVAAPLIAEAPVSMECRLHTRVPFEKRDLLIGEIVWLHVRDGSSIDRRCASRPTTRPSAASTRTSTRARATVSPWIRTPTSRRCGGRVGCDLPGGSGSKPRRGHRRR